MYQKAPATRPIMLILTNPRIATVVSEASGPPAVVTPTAVAVAAMVQERGPTGSAPPAPSYPGLVVFSAMMIAAAVVAGGKIWGREAEG